MTASGHNHHANTRWQLYTRFIIDCSAVLYLFAALYRQAGKDLIWIPALAAAVMLLVGGINSKRHGPLYEWSMIAGAMILIGYLTLLVGHQGFFFLGFNFIGIGIDLLLVGALAYRLCRPVSANGSDSDL